MFHIVLVRPEIPPNTGNAIRLAANTGCTLHLVHPLGFAMDEKRLRRAGLDYHEWAQVREYRSWPLFLAEASPSPERCFAFSSKASQPFANLRWLAGDWLVFGSETRGLDSEVLAHFAVERRVRLPMRAGQRSLNLSNSVAVAVFEAWRQNGYAGGG
jgi:tRNA (cytidine/uridine-2'-O-)-methyltransferase